MAKTYQTPLYYDESRKAHVPIPAGQYVDASCVPVSSSKDNALEMTDDGLYVAPSETQDVTVVSADSGNVISEGSDGGALLTKTGFDALVEVYLMQNLKIVSDNANNLLRVGTDGGAHLTADDVLSNGDMNLLTVHPTDMKVFLSSETVRKNLDLASDVAGNLLLTDEDGKLYLLADSLVSAYPGLLTVGSDGKLACSAELKYDSSTGILSLVDKDGDVVSEVAVTVAVSVLKDVRLEKDGDEIDMVFVFELSDGSEKELKVDMTELVDVYEAGDGISLDGNVFSVDIVKNGGLTINANGKLTISASVIAEKIASSGATENMVSDEEGNKLEVDSDGKLYVSGTEYTGVSPVKVEGTEISVELDPDGGLTAGDGGLKVDTSAMAQTLVSDEEGNSLKVGDDGGLYVDCASSATDVLSDDDGNAIELGTDEKLYMPLDWGEMEDD